MFNLALNLETITENRFTWSDLKANRRMITKLEKKIIKKSFFTRKKGSDPLKRI